MSGRGLPAAYSWDTAFALVAGYTPSGVIEKKLRSWITPGNRSTGRRRNASYRRSWTTGRDCFSGRCRRPAKS
jgi:hypothetical protein